MKIWVIGRSYPEPDNNMIGSFELEQAKVLQRNGEEVCFLCASLHPNKVIKGWGYQSWQEDGMTICTYSKHFFPRVFPLYFLKLRNYFWKVFLRQVCEERGKPDIIHVHYPAMLMIADALRPFHDASVRIIVTEHWSKVLSKSLDIVENKAYQKYFEYIDTAICVGRPLANVVKEMVGDNKPPVRVVPNVVDKEFRPIFATNVGFEFVAVGRLDKVKQFDQIIQAFSECFREKLARLTIIGGGEEYNSLQNLISELSMERKIVLTGSLPRQQVAERIAKADCLVCYSSFETFGVPIAEAWACGVPTITTTTAAVIDDFDSRLGVQVSSGNRDDLKEKMQYMYNNISSFDKKFISQFAQENFSEEVIYQRLKNIYLETVQ